ncbi:hypothetical protein [Stackebrandtia soli]|uniref:hypothetical protein n=1 Tax=Stackebrandtia soli TaxID=1892856 RepID=UPI0039E8D646
MNDDELDAALRGELRRHARSAPMPTELLTSVKARGRRRVARQRIAGVLAVAAVSITGVGIGLSTPQSDELAAMFGADEVKVCVESVDGRVTEVAVVEMLSGDDVEANTGVTDGATASLRHVVRGEEFTVTVEVGAVSWEDLTDVESVVVDGESGRLAVDRDGRRVLVIESSVDGSSVMVRTGNRAPSDRQLVEWVSSFSFHRGLDACGY